MKIKRMLGLVLACSMLFSVPTMAEETEAVASDVSADYFESVEFDTMEPIRLSSAQVDEVFADNNGIQPLITTPDEYEPNDTWLTAKPYDSVEVITPQLTSRHELYTLGMRTAGLHSDTDVDWYTTRMESGETYFVDIRNVGSRNVFIEVYYVYPDNTATVWSTDPSINSVFAKQPEKYFYFQPEISGTYYIRVASGGDWSADMMNYFFYVGPAIQTFRIVNMPTYGSVQIWGDDYRTYTCNLTGTAVPAQTAIINLSISNKFPQGKECSEVMGYMRAGGKTYYTSSSGAVSGITQAPLGQSWTIGGKCKNGSHFTYWTAVMNGSFACIMAPYPGNEIDF